MSKPAGSMRALVGALILLVGAATFGFWGEVLLFPPQMSYAHTLDLDELLEEMSPVELGEPIAPLEAAILERIFAASQATQAMGRRDPFLNARESRSAIGVASPIRADIGWPKLTAIIRVGAEYTAILDAQVAHAGETVAGVAVLKIEAETVCVRRDGKRRVLSLVSGSSPVGIEVKS